MSYSELRKFTFEREVCARLPADAIALIDPSEVACIDTGVLLLHGSWSAESAVCLRCWEPALHEIRLPKPWLYVLDEMRFSIALADLIGEWPEAGYAYGIRQRRIQWRRKGHGRHCIHIAGLCAELEETPPQSSRVQLVTREHDVHFSDLLEPLPQTLRVVS